MKSNDKSLTKLYGIYSFHTSAKSVLTPSTPAKRKRYKTCSIDLLEQGKNIKPHIIIKDVTGEIVFEIGARSTNAYATLLPLVGKTVDSFSWSIKTSLFDKMPYFDCTLNLTSATGVTPTIGRIILDTETTGLSAVYDELLQVAIIDGEGNELLNHYYKPQHNTKWPEAQAVHHISPQQVKNCPPISDDIDRIQELFDTAQEVFVYNAPFDLAFFGELGLHLDKAKVRDTMREYGQKYHNTQYYKLEKAANECNYFYQAHDALSDCYATLVVQCKVDGLPVPEKLAPYVGQGFLKTLLNALTNNTQPDNKKANTIPTAQSTLEVQSVSEVQPVFEEPVVQVQHSEAEVNEPAPEPAPVPLPLPTGDNTENIAEPASSSGKKREHGKPYNIVMLIVHSLLFAFALLMTIGGISVTNNNSTVDFVTSVIMDIIFAIITLVALSNSAKTWKRLTTTNTPNQEEQNQEE